MGDPGLLKPLEELLTAFVQQNRMKLPGTSAYRPSYRIVDERQAS
jgi:hypothetical protein